MLASEITLADRGRYIHLVSKGKDFYGLVVSCSHGDPAIQLADGKNYHFGTPEDTVEFITEKQAIEGTLSEILSLLY